MRNTRVKNARIWSFCCINWCKGKILTTIADVSQLLMFQRRPQDRATTWASPTWTPTIIVTIIIIPNTTSTTIGLKTEFHRPPRCLPCYAASQYRLVGLGPIWNSCWIAAWASQDRVLVPSQHRQPLHRSEPPSLITIAIPLYPRLLSTKKRTATITTTTSTAVASITSTIIIIIIITISIIFTIISTCR